MEPGVPAAIHAAAVLSSATVARDVTTVRISVQDATNNVKTARETSVRTAAAVLTASVIPDGAATVIFAVNVRTPASAGKGAQDVQ